MAHVRSTDNVRLYTLLNQHHHGLIERSEGRKLIFASPDETIKLVELFRDSLETMIGGIDKRTKRIIQAMADLAFKPKQRIGVDERMKLANYVKKNPQTIYQLLERLYATRLLKKGKEGDGKTAPVFYELVMDPLEMVASPLLSQSEIQELRGEMQAAGFAFLKAQNLPKEVLSAIMKEWGRPFEEARNRQKLENEQFLVSPSSLNRLRRSMRNTFGENGSDSGAIPFSKLTPAAGQFPTNGVDNREVSRA